MNPEVDFVNMFGVSNRSKSVLWDIFSVVFWIFQDYSEVGRCSSVLFQTLPKARIRSAFDVRQSVEHCLKLRNRLGIKYSFNICLLARIRSAFDVRRSVEQCLKLRNLFGIKYSFNTCPLARIRSAFDVR